MSQPARSTTSIGGVERRQWASPRVGQHDGRVLRPDAGPVRQRNPELVGAQVETGARTDLEQPQGQAVTRGHVQQPAEQGRGTADLVGLRRLVEAGTELVAVMLENRAQRGPCPLGVGSTADRRVEERQLRRPPFEHQPVHTAQQPQRERGRPRIVLVTGQHGGGGTSAEDVFRDLRQERGVERGPELVACLRLHADQPRQALGRPGAGAHPCRLSRASRSRAASACW